MSDGKLVFETSVDKKGYIDGIREMTSDQTSLKKMLSKTNNELDKLSEKMREISTQRIPTTEYREVTEQIQRTRAELDKLLIKQEKMQALGTNTKGSAWKSLQYDIAEARNTLKYANGELKELNATGQAFTLGSKSAEFQDMQAQYTALNQKAEEYRLKLSEVEQTGGKSGNRLLSLQRASMGEWTKIGTAVRKVGSSAKSALKSIIGLFTKANKTARTHHSYIGMIIKSFLGFTIISKVFMGLYNIISSMLKSNQEFVKNLSVLKGNLYSAFQPIYEAILPWINALMSALVTLSAYMAQFTSFLFGASLKATQNNAKEQYKYAQAIRNTAKEAKKANKQLASFDELNNRSSDTGGGGGTANQPVEPTFGKVEVDDSFTTMLEGLKQALEPTIEALKRLWTSMDGFKNFVATGAIDFYNSFLKPVGAYVLGDKGLPKLIDAIADMFKNIKWKSLNADLRNFFNALVPLGTMSFDTFSTFVEKFLIPLGTWSMNEALPRLLTALTLFATNVDLTYVNTALVGLYEAILPFAENIGNGLLWFIENVLAPIGVWVVNEALPSFLGLLASGIGALNDVITVLQPLGTWLFDNLLAPLGKWTGELFISALESITGLLDRFGEWCKANPSVVEGIAIAIGSFATALTLVNVAVKLWNVIGVIATGVTSAFGTAVAILTSPITLVVGAITLLITTIVLLVKHWDKVKAVASKVWESIKGVWGVASAWLNEHFIKPTAQFFSGLWSGIKKGLEIIKGAFKTVFTALVNIVKTPINFIIDIINGMVSGVVDGLNFVFGALNKLSFKVPDWFPVGGGSTVGFSLPTINYKRIPKLANGTVVPKNYGDFMAILGDNKKEPEVVSPISTIREAVRSEMGGGNDKPLLVQVFLSGKMVYEEMVNQDRQEIARTGKSRLARA